jgi:23S rRNA (uracil1939-C5)-methyltransferase
VCEVFGSCGGCAWQHVAYPHQLEAKRRILADALARIAGLELPLPIGMRPSPAAYGYRSRTRVLVRGGRVGYRRRRSHALCATARCPLLVPPLQERLAELAAAPPPRDGEWELACAGEQTRAGPPTRPGPRLELRVAGERVGFSPGVFAQSNALLLEPLVAALLAAAGSGRRVIELFAGAGLFTLGLARRFASAVAVESDPRAVDDLRHNLAAARLTNVEVIGERVEQALASGALAGASPEVAVLDPPRTGLPPGAAGALAGLGAGRIVYLSCDPATLARDLALLAEAGYALRSVEGFDLFPQTPHVEALAVSERAGERRPEAGSRPLASR